MSNPLLSGVVNALNIAVIELTKDGNFRLISDRQPWLSAFLPAPVASDGTVTMPDELSYLGNFLIDAEAHWQSGSATKLSSGIWNECLASGETCHLEAYALIIDNRKVLIIKIIDIGLTEDHLREQKIKENMLAFEDLIRTEQDLEKYSFLLETEVNNRTADLQERIRELHCLYNLSRLVEERSDSLHAIFQGAIEIIPSGWRYPDITCVRLSINGDVYATSNWRETDWKMECPIAMAGGKSGRLEIGYIEQRPLRDDGPFCYEERSLLTAISEILSHNIKRIKAEQELRTSYKMLTETFEDTISAIGHILEIKDPYTAAHQVRVAKLAVAIGEELALNEEQLHSIYIAAMIHDVGKLYVPSDLLSKPGNLTDIEFKIIKTHVENSYKILSGIKFPWPIATIALQHHERLDGSGYPNSLKGNDIMLESRIIAVADVVEAISTHRPYRPSKGVDKALEEIINNRGILYDCAAVDACIKIFKEKGFAL